MENNNIEQENSIQNNIEEQEKKEDSGEYNIKTNIFEGPLDLLLHLVKTSEIDICDIQIAEITNQYLSYLSFLLILNLDNISDFVEMATTLVLLKSRALLPVELEFDHDEEDPRMELISKLLEYQKYKIAAGLLETKSEESLPFIYKNNEPDLFTLDDDDNQNWKQLSVLDLISAFADILNQSEKRDIELEVLLYHFTVEDKINYIMKFLEEKESFNYFEVVKEHMPKVELICTFLALLELVKKGVIFIRQHILFGDIHIVRRENWDKVNLLKE